mmetsp:Transcript_104868/g.313302  ORF Transcript_104868/g.313302 Transcript_104868/m.313302 type:complete len:251 (-) Transcript_104868:894-1646(-)
MTLLQDPALLQETHLLDGFDAPVKILHGHLRLLGSDVPRGWQAQALAHHALLVLRGLVALRDLLVLLDAQDLLHALRGVANLDGLPSLRSLLDLGHKGPVSPGSDRGHSACPASACRAADSVQVVREVHGKVKQDDVVHVLEVEAARGQVRANHHVSSTACELPPNLLPLLGVDIAMQSHSADALLQHALVHVLACRHAVGEDERLPAHRRHLSKDIPKDRLQPLASCRHEHLLDLGRRHVCICGHDRQH